MKSKSVCCIIASLLSLNVCAAEYNNATPEWRYSARPNDNLIRLAKIYLNNPADWRVLQQLNGFKNPNKIQAGQVVRMPLHLMKQTPVPAEITVISGQVEIKRAGGVVGSAQVGDLIAIGSQVSTGNNSKVALKMADGSIVNVEPNSILALDTMSVYKGGGMVDTKMRLQSGRVEVQANPKHQMGNQMQVTTPSAVAAVRGTVFRVGSETGTETSTMFQETLNGKVDLSAAGETIAVAGGLGSLSKNGQAPLPPVVLLPAPNLNSVPVAINQMPTTFTMPASAAVAEYAVKIAQDANFNQLAFNGQTQQHTLQLSDLPDGDYYFNARGVDTLGLQGFDTTKSVTINALPAAPALQSPKLDEISRNSNPTLTWQTVSDAQSYLLELATDATFNQTIFKQTVAENSVRLAQNLLPQTYYWRVTSIDQHGAGPLGKTQAFSYKPVPNVPDLTVLKWQNLESGNTSSQLKFSVDAPQPNCQYEAFLSSDAAGKQVTWRGTSQNGDFEMPRPSAGHQYLSIRQAEAGDGASAYSQTPIVVPLRETAWQPLRLISPQNHSY